MRGPARLHVGGRGKVGIIPACAGTSSATCRRTRRSRDHPRVCGDQPLPWSALGLPPGSSPRVRGPAPGHRRLHSPDGIIPACAGTREHVGHPHGDDRDHPRVCGDQAAECAGAPMPWGSSPRVRGPGRGKQLQGIRKGIIPACAGTSYRRVHLTMGGRDHPRVCGDQFPGGADVPSHLGSSPRVRGPGGNKGARP